MDGARRKAIIDSLFIGALVALNCYLFFEDGVFIAQKTSPKSDSLPADDIGESTGDPTSPEVEEED